jgi:peptidoglycan/LPS O-acetylase OafA/YrhL
MKSVLAVLAGLVVTITMSLGLDLLMYTTAMFPANSAEMTDAHWLIATAYRIVIAIFGSYVTARLAPSRPMKHALIAGGIGMSIATLGAVLSWNKGPDFGPHWYPLALVITALPCAWIGAKLNGDVPR